MTYVFSLFWIFFFQAEDGIRDLVRSRGLGDVYKRQGIECLAVAGNFDIDKKPAWLNFISGRGRRGWAEAVSYTHLTLPTSDLV